MEGLDLLKPSEGFGPLEKLQDFGYTKPDSSGFFEKLMGGLSQDPTTLLKEGGKGDAFKSLMMMLTQMQGGR